MSDRYDHLILKSLSGTITANEYKILSSWLNESAENRKNFEGLEKVWHLEHKNNSKPNFNTDKEWDRLQKSVDEIAEGNVRRLKWYPQSSFALRMAATVLLLAVSSFLLYWYVLNDETLRESGDATVSFSLTDGSNVWLNRNSRLTVCDNFNDINRTVELKGEAFFDVQKNPDKPFIILTGQTRIRVVGTSFNVSAYSEGVQEAIFVVTGKVKVSSMRDTTQFIALNAGETGILNKKNDFLIQTTEGSANVLSWKTKQLVFRRTSLAEVVKTMEHYFDIVITVKNPDVLKCHFTGSFNDPTLQEIIESLSISLNLTITRTEKECIVDGTGC